MSPLDSPPAHTHTHNCYQLLSGIYKASEQGGDACQGGTFFVLEE